MLIVFTVFGLVSYANAAALNWSVDQTIDLSSPDIDLTISAGSVATSLTVNAGNITVILGSGDVFIVTPASGALTVSGNSSSSVTNSCSSGLSTVTITGGSSGETVTITPTGIECVVQSSSGSKPKSKTTPPVVVSPTTTPGTGGSGGACSYALGLETLKNGSRGPAVMELQRFLNATMNLGLVIDGILGPRTVAVMMQWQTANGLVSDGLIGPMTKAKINSIAQARCVNPATPTTPNAQGYAFGTGVVREGTKGNACLAWQTFLNDKVNAGLITDGWCGKSTMAAARSWQASVGLVADGLLGPMSRTKANAQ